MLSETQMGVVGPNDMPQGFLSLGSRCAAKPGMSEARLVWVKNWPRLRPPASERSWRGSRVSNAGEVGTHRERMDMGVLLGVSAAAPLPTGTLGIAAGIPGKFRVAEARGEVVVDHAGRLHEGVADRRSDKLEAP